MKVNARTALFISGPQGGNEKLVIDRAYFDDLLAKLRCVTATLDIVTEYRLFACVLTAASTLDADVRKDKLHSFEAAFGEK